MPASAGDYRRRPAPAAGTAGQHKPDIVIIELGANDGLRGYLRSLACGPTWKKLAHCQPGPAPGLYWSPWKSHPTTAPVTLPASARASSISPTAPTAPGPFLLGLGGDRPALMQADGIHPSAEAQVTLLRNILPTIQSGAGALMSDWTWDKLQAADRATIWHPTPPPPTHPRWCR